MVLNIVKFTILVLLLWLIFVYLIPQVASEEFQVFVREAGILGPIAVTVYIIFSHIFAPVAGTPVVLASVAILGIYETMFLIYIGGVISSVINFYIARIWGRGLVKRFIGEKAILEIDKHTETFGTRALIIGRIFGFAIFEIISYAAGLTNVSFKKYITITIIFSSIPSILFAALFKDVDFSTTSSLFIWLGILVITGIIFSFLTKKFLAKK